MCRPLLPKRRAIVMLDRVGIPEPETRMRQYLHELSGCMRQRVVIAIMMLLEPSVFNGDEPTTALDVTVQAQILDLLREMATETQIGLILITHDMGFVAEMADNVLVMESGHTEEYGHVSQIFAKPNVVYTRTLLEAVPRLDCISERDAIAPNTLLSATNITKTFKTRGTMFLHDQGHVALDDVSLEILRGETLPLVGKSGAGKTTLGRVIARLTDPEQG